TRYSTRSYSQWDWCDLSSLQNRSRDLTVLAPQIGTADSWLQQAHTSPSLKRTSRPPHPAIESDLNGVGDNELAEALRLTVSAVRSHLASLERDGLVQELGMRPGFRKPHVLYSLTGEAEYLSSLLMVRYYVMCSRSLAGAYQWYAFCLS